ARSFSLFFTVGSRVMARQPLMGHRQPDRPKKRKGETRRGTWEGTARIIGKLAPRLSSALRRVAPSIGEPMSTSQVVKSPETPRPAHYLCIAPLDQRGQSARSEYRNPRKHEGSFF